MSSFTKVNQTHYPLCVGQYIPKEAQMQESESAPSSSLSKEHVVIRGEVYYKLDNCKLSLKFLQLCLTDPFTQPFMATAAIAGELAMGVLNGLLSIVSCDLRQLREAARLVAHACSIPFALIALEFTAILGVVAPHYSRHYYSIIEGYIYRQFIPEQGAFFRFTSNIFGPVKNVNAHQLHLDQQQIPATRSGLLEFLKQAYTHSTQTGSAVPSSYFLAAEITSFMERRLESAAPMRILEVGAGSGAFTQEILRKLRPDDLFDIVEVEEGFCHVLEELCAGRTNVAVHHKSILDFDSSKYDLIISGVPFHALNSPAFFENVYTKYIALAKEDAVISQFEYIALPKLGAYFLCGEKRKNHLEILQIKARYIQEYSATIAPVYWNIPPAQVLHYEMNKKTSTDPDTEAL